MKLLTVLLISASLWAQTPCLNGDGPLQVGQEQCDVLHGVLPMLSLNWSADSITVLYCESSCGEYLKRPTQLTLTAEGCAEIGEDGLQCSFLVIKDFTGRGFRWRVGDGGDEWVELFGDVQLVASPIGDRL